MTSEITPPDSLLGFVGLNGGGSHPIVSKHVVAISNAVRIMTLPRCLSNRWSMVRTHERQRLRSRPILDVRLELRAKLADGGFDRPARSIRQPANRRARHDSDPIADLDQNIQILAPSLTFSDAIHDLQHPARSFSAWRALPA